MNIITQTKINHPAILAFDVSKDRLNLAVSIAGYMTDHEFANQTLVVESKTRGTSPIFTSHQNL